MTSVATNPVDQRARSDAPRLMRIATYASVATAFLLIGIKTGAWLLTGSVALLASLLDSLLDAMASIITLIAVRHATTPADREHRFGHGKAEPLAALAQSAFILGSAVLLLFEAGNRLVNPRPVAYAEVGIAVIAVSFVATLGLVLFQRWVIRRTNSLAITADSLHYKGDLLMNAAVIAALVLTGWFGWIYADPIFGAGIAIYIAYNATIIVRDAFDMLMDRELPQEERERIYAIVRAHPEAHRAHDLKTRRSGRQIFIQLHLELDPDMPLLRAHRICDDVEKRILDAFPEAEVIIHQDPEGIEEDHPSYR